MVTAQLIIARAVHIGASILLAGIFTFDLVILGSGSVASGSGDLREIERRLVPPGRLESRSQRFSLLSSGFGWKSRA